MLEFKSYALGEALSVAARRKKAVAMRKNKARLAIGRKKMSMRIADKKRLEKRAMRQVRSKFAKKMTKGVNKADLTPARKKEIETRLNKPAMAARIKKIAKRTVKDVRKQELQRKRGKR